MTDEDAKAGQDVPREEQPLPYIERVADSNSRGESFTLTGEYGGICESCGSRTYRVNATPDGHHHRQFDACPECGSDQEI